MASSCPGLESRRVRHAGRSLGCCGWLARRPPRDHSCFDNNCPDFPDDVGAERPGRSEQPRRRRLQRLQRSGDFSTSQLFPREHNMPAQTTSRRIRARRLQRGRSMVAERRTTRWQPQLLREPSRPSGDDWTTGWTAFPADYTNSPTPPKRRPPGRRFFLGTRSPLATT